MFFFCVPLCAGTRVYSNSVGSARSMYSNRLVFNGFNNAEVKIGYLYEEDVTAMVITVLAVDHALGSLSLNKCFSYTEVIFSREGYNSIRRWFPATTGNAVADWFYAGNAPGGYWWNLRFKVSVTFPSASEWVVDPTYELPEVPSENVTEDDLRICSMIFGALLFIPFSRFMRP